RCSAASRRSSAWFSRGSTMTPMTSRWSECAPSSTDSPPVACCNQMLFVPNALGPCWNGTSPACKSELLFDTPAGRSRDTMAWWVLPLEHPEVRNNIPRQLHDEDAHDDEEHSAHEGIAVLYGHPCSEEAAQKIGGGHQQSQQDQQFSMHAV